jgi:sugar phosphate isomerase/epimerase
MFFLPFGSHVATISLLKMIRSSVTISLVPEARGGPFIFQNGLDQGLEKAASQGFDAVELFLPSAACIAPNRFREQLEDRNLSLSALATGGGFLKNGWTLCSRERSVRQKARDFISEMMCLGSEFQVPVIIGSMKGSVSAGEDREIVSARLCDQLRKLADKAAEIDAQILLEPLNRYETNLVNTLKEGVSLLKKLDSGHLKLLADLFHMNIEEVSIWQALSEARQHLGYLHFVDSNRWAAGSGHLDFGELASVLFEIQYKGYLSAEALPLPDPEAAARRTMKTYQRLIHLINQEET